MGAYLRIYGNRSCVVYLEDRLRCLPFAQLNIEVCLEPVLHHGPDQYYAETKQKDVNVEFLLPTFA